MTQRSGVHTLIYEKHGDTWREWRSFWNTYTAVMTWCRATGSLPQMLSILDDVRAGSMFERASLADGRPLLIGLAAEVQAELGIRKS